MAILQISLKIPTPRQNLSSSTVLTGHENLNIFLLPKLSRLSIHTSKSMTIQMGGGPRTFPGGVSKWQWKRMQAKKAKQLLKARLCRERQIYEMRKRAELKAAVSELEKPWEVVERAPNLFSVRADEQVKVLADRFQRPGGYDLWSEKDGPQLFQSVSEVPSARFFPKGVVHSIKPYGRIGKDDDDVFDDRVDELSSPVEQGNKFKNTRRFARTNPIEGTSVVKSRGECDEFPPSVERIDGYKKTRKFSSRRLGNGSNSERKSSISMEGSSVAESSDKESNFVRGRMERHNFNKVGDTERRRNTHTTRSLSNRRSGLQKVKNSRSEVYDMSLQQDGSFGFLSEKDQYILSSGSINNGGNESAKSMRVLYEEDKF